MALRYFPKGPDPAFEALIGREMTATARLIAPLPQGNPKLTRWLHRLDMPSLILWGDKDRMRPVEQGRVWERLMPKARLVTTPETGHLLFEERPEAVEAVTKFLRSQ